MKIRNAYITSLILGLTLLFGCTLLEVESTKTEMVSTPDKKTVDLTSRVTELEKRIEELENKLKGAW
jgi:outer membrane murein-binding lipoprotein Lpp